MSDLRELLKEEYRKKKTTINPQSLMEMVEEMMQGLEYVSTRSDPRVLTEKAAQQAANMINQNMKNILDFLPKIEISEEAWGQKDPTEGSARQEFEKYMRTIRGTTIKGKLTYLNNFIDSGAPTAYDTGQILSNLMFLDLLSTVVNNFSPSGAGFLFEAFLAGLLKGTQSVEKAGGELQIDDLIAYSDDPNRMFPISLKLLSPTTPVKGSVKNLIGFLVNNPAGINYLCVYKYGKGQTSAIGFYEFQITPQNIYYWIPKDLGMKIDLQEGTWQQSVKRQEEVRKLVDATMARSGTQIPRLGSLKKALDQGDNAALEVMTSAEAQEAFNLVQDAVSDVGVPEILLDKLQADITMAELSQWSAEDIHVLMKRRKDVFTWLRNNLPSDHPLGYHKGTKKIKDAPAQRIDKLNALYETDPGSWGKKLLDMAGIHGYKADIFSNTEDEVEETSPLNESKESQFEIASPFITKQRLPPLYQHQYNGSLTVNKIKIDKIATEYTHLLMQGVVAIFEQLSLLAVNLTDYFVGPAKTRIKKGSTAVTASKELVTLVNNPKLIQTKQ